MTASDSTMSKTSCNFPATRLILTLNYGQECWWNPCLPEVFKCWCAVLNSLMNEIFVVISFAVVKHLQAIEAEENWGIMKALRRSVLYLNYKEYAVLLKASVFWLGFAERSYMGLKCQLVTNLDSQKIFTFTVRGGYSVNPNLNFSCCVFLLRWEFSRFAFRRFLVNHLNKACDSFSRCCNALFKILLIECWVVSAP